jgi:hypothetical protein
MTEKWFAFKAYNTETMYGFGTEAEASEYQDHLNKDRAINHYGITPVKDPTTINGVEFNIGDELQALKEGW